jgi:hypothetical protein
MVSRTEKEKKHGRSLKRGTEEDIFLLFNNQATFWPNESYLMKASLFVTAIAALLILGLVSCGETSGPANDPEVAAGVLASTTPMCAVNMTSSTATV